MPLFVMPTTMVSLADSTPPAPDIIPIAFTGDAVCPSTAGNTSVQILNLGAKLIARPGYETTDRLFTSGIQVTL